MNIELKLGDCLDVLRTIPDNSIDSVVTDPPYGLEFMGKKWDYDVPSVEIWTECLRVLKSGGHLLSFAGSRTYHRMAVRIEDAGFEIRDQIMWVYGSGFPKSHSSLKPAHEPIVMARKPLSEKSIAENVLKHGTGGINIDGSRIDYQNDNDRSGWFKSGSKGSEGFAGERNFAMRAHSAEEIQERCGQGRFPANIIFDEDAGKLLGEASRFFYCPKTSKKDRNEGDVSNGHPTVKPTDLMRYLINLITPPNGTVLDPFMGSGSTGKAAVRAGFNFIGIEREQEYMDIAKARIEHENNKPIQKELFD
jgi:DNA modification methylase